MYTKRPVYQIKNTIEWDVGTPTGDDVEFIEENNLDMYSGFDIFKINRENNTSKLIASLDNEQKSLIDLGDGEYKLFRSGSVFTGSAYNTRGTKINSVKNDDSIVKGFRYGDHISYNIIPSPMISSYLDRFGRRLIMSDIKTSNIDFNVEDREKPRNIIIDSYNIKLNNPQEGVTEKSTYDITVNFKPLNGDGIGPITVFDRRGNQRTSHGYYEVSGSNGVVNTILQPSIAKGQWAEYANPPRAGKDLLITKADGQPGLNGFNRETDIIQYSDTVLSGVFKPSKVMPWENQSEAWASAPKVQYKISAISSNEQKSSSSLAVYLTPLQDIAPVYVRDYFVAGSDMRAPDGIVLSWALRGEGVSSSFVEVWKGVGMSRGGLAPEIKLERKGIFSAQTRTVNFNAAAPTGAGIETVVEGAPEPEASVITAGSVERTLYTLIDNDRDIKLTNLADTIIVRYALRLIHPRDADPALPENFPRQASKFQYYRSDVEGSLEYGTTNYLELEIKRRRKPDSGADLIGGLEPQVVRALKKRTPIVDDPAEDPPEWTLYKNGGVIKTRKEFVLSPTKNADRNVTLVIFEPKSGLYTEKTYNMKKIRD